MNQKYRAPTVRKAFQILRLLARRESGLRLSEIARQLQIGKSTVHGLVAALEQEDAVERDPDSKRFSLGLGLLGLGRAVDARMDLKQVAHPFMEDLRAKTQESVFLGSRSFQHTTIVDIVESTRDLKITSPIGTRLPLLAGATGKVFLAALPAEQAGAWLDAKQLRRYTENSITDAEKYLQELERVRREGYALDDEEYIPGVRAVASAISGPRQPMSAIWVVGFTPSMSADKTRMIAQETKRTAAAIGQCLME